MGLDKEDVLVVDIAGDLPLRPTGLFKVEKSDLLDPINFVNPVKIFIENGFNAGKKNVHSEYSQNPNGKYTYVRVVDGFNEHERWPWQRHGIGINGALDPNREFVVEINGRKLSDPINLKVLYENFLRGELK
ncbi:MAG: hypothetical protein WBB84_07950 [Candidatus Omnitrophota bacterium]